MNFKNIFRQPTFWMTVWILFIPLLLFIINYLFNNFYPKTILAFDISFYTIYYYLLITPLVVTTLSIWMFYFGIKLLSKKDKKISGKWNIALSFILIISLILFYIII